MQRGNRVSVQHNWDSQIFGPELKRAPIARTAVQVCNWARRGCLTDAILDLGRTARAGRPVPWATAVPYLYQVGTAAAAGQHSHARFQLPIRIPIRAAQVYCCHAAS